MRVLVTGGNGFVGKHVLAALSATKHEVLAPTREDINLLHHHDDYYDHAIPRSLAFELSHNKIDAVIHLAALCGGIGINKENPGKFMYENLQMGMNVIEACRLADVKKLVNLSTVCSYPKFTPVPFKESDIWNGYPEETNAPYGIAKKACVELGIAYHKQYGLNVTNLVPVNMAGEHDNFYLDSSHVLPALIRKFEEAQAGKYSIPIMEIGKIDSDGSVIAYHPVTIWGTGKASREFLYAGDCAKAIVIALETDTGPEPINLGTGEEITIKELALLVRDVGGYHAGISWDISKPDGQPRRCLDTSLAWKKLGWKSTTTIKETVRRTIDWYRANNGQTKT